MLIRFVYNFCEHLSLPHSPTVVNRPISDKGGWQEGNRHTPSDQKVPWSDPLQDQLLDSFCDDMFGMNLGGPGQKMGPPGNGTPHQVSVVEC